MPAAVLASVAALGCGAAACGAPRVVPPAAQVPVAAAPRADPAPPPSVAPAEEALPPVVPASGLLVMRPDAVVLDAPRRGATASELMPYSSLAHLYGARAARPARVVGRAGAYYAVATGEPPQGTCYPDQKGLFPGLSLTVFVHEDDVFPVLTRPLEQRFGSGSVRLHPGVALGPPSRRGGDAHHREAAALPLSVALLIPDDAVGLTYEPPAPAARAPAAAAPDAQLSGTCEAPGACLLWLDGDAAARISGPDNVLVKRLSRSGERSRVSITGACVEVQATVSEGALRPLPKIGVGHGFGTACGGFSSRDFEIRPGTSAYWPDGRVAGAVGRDRMWMHGYLSEQVGGRRCFKRHPTLRTTCGSEGRFLRVCFDDADVKPIGER